MTMSIIQTNYPVGSKAYLFSGGRSSFSTLTVTRHNADGGLSLAYANGTKVRVTDRGDMHSSLRWRTHYIHVNPADGIVYAEHARAENRRLNRIGEIRMNGDALAAPLRKPNPDMAEVAALAEKIAAAAKES